MNERLKDVIIEALAEKIDRLKSELITNGYYIEDLRAENAKLKEAQADVLPQ